ncbi:MAG: LamG-like jellyroll fold domain-containing protein [Candidatus Kapabacteria bacterium]|nr:LamG-like jellyroll fold domain-containing protein [Candidatus Kapabacteria bacterium]
MKKLVAILVVIFLVISACSDSNNPADNFGKIEIHVMNVKDNSPISNALISTDPASESITTDSNGEYLLGNLSPGNYNVIAAKFGFITNSITVNVLENKTVQANIFLYDESFNNILPGKPTLLSPSNNSKQTNTYANLKWTCIDENKDELSYTIYFDEVNPPLKILTGGSVDTIYNVQNLQKMTQYYWYVVAKDKYGSGPKSSVYTFKIDTVEVIVPDNTVLNMPFDGSYQDVSNSKLTTICSNSNYGTGRKGDANGSFAFLNRNTITVKNNYVIDFTNNFSVSFWINPNSGYGFDMIDNLVHVLGRAGGTGTNSSSWYVELSSLGNIIFGTYNTSSQSSRQSTNSKIEVGKWTHVCIIYSNSIVSFYVNGDLDKEMSIPPPQTSNYDIHIGGRVITSNRYLNGYLDDLKIYNKVLTSDEVMSLYNE